jgi:hypothetical protein
MENIRKLNIKGLFSIGMLLVILLACSQSVWAFLGPADSDNNLDGISNVGALSGVTGITGGTAITSADGAHSLTISDDTTVVTGGTRLSSGVAMYSALGFGGNNIVVDSTGINLKTNTLSHDLTMNDMDGTKIHGGVSMYSDAVFDSGNSITVDSTSARLVSTNALNSVVVNNTGANVTVANNGLNVEAATNAVTLTSDNNASAADSRGQLSLAPTSATLFVNTSTGAAHGVDINQSRTIISGGTSSTSLTLDDNGASFSNSSPGGPTRLSGIAAGTSEHDAVNYGQLKRVEQRAYSGIAAVAAMANIPPPAQDKSYSLGVGYGNYLGEDAMAIGGKTYVGKKRRVMLSASVGYTNQNPTTGVGASYSW